MKITDVTLTLFAWTDIPTTLYGRHTGRFGGQSQLGLLRVVTDEGLEGNAFLGSASRSAEFDAASIGFGDFPVTRELSDVNANRLPVSFGGGTVMPTRSVASVYHRIPQIKQSRKRASQSRSSLRLLGNK